MTATHREALRPWVWLAPALLLLIPFFVLPIGIVARNSFNIDDPLRAMVQAFTLANYELILGDRFYGRIFANSIGLAALISVATLILCYPVAYYCVFRARANPVLLLWLVYTPLIISVIVRVFGWMALISDSGVLNSTLLRLGLADEPIRLLYNANGLTVGLVHRYLPLMMLPLITALRKIDVAAIKASANLGAAGRATFFRIVVPLSFPGIVAGLQLVFAGAISDFVLPNLMGGSDLRLLAPTILSDVVGQVSLARAAALASSMLVLVAGLLFGTNLLIARCLPWTRYV